MTPEQRTLADAVAAQIGLQVAPGFDAHWAQVYDLPDGGRLYISGGRQHGQLNISTSVADSLRDHRAYYREGEAPKTSINVSDSKDPQKIAADVRRRLLPEYEREAEACKASKARHDDRNAQRMVALTKVAAVFGEHIQCDERSGEPHPISIDRESQYRLTAKCYGDAVKLEIEVSPEIAARIAALLVTL